MAAATRRTSDKGLQAGWGLLTSENSNKRQAFASRDPKTKQETFALFYLKASVFTISTYHHSIDFVRQEIFTTSTPFLDKIGNSNYRKTRLYSAKIYRELRINFERCFRPWHLSRDRKTLVMWRTWRSCDRSKWPRPWRDCQIADFVRTFSPPVTGRGHFISKGQSFVIGRRYSLPLLSTLTDLTSPSFPGKDSSTRANGHLPRGFCWSTIITMSSFFRLVDSWNHFGRCWRECRYSLCHLCHACLTRSCT